MTRSVPAYPTPPAPEKCLTRLLNRCSRVWRKESFQEAFFWCGIRAKSSTMPLTVMPA